MGLDLCFKLTNVHSFDVLRLLMRYLGNFCQITAVVRLISNYSACPLGMAEF